MIMDAPFELNATVGRMLGKMLLVAKLLPILCTGDYQFDVAYIGIRMSLTRT